MKIHQLPIGASFEYAGEIFVKTGPLIGTGPSGQRLIPKYAVLKVAGAPVPNTREPTATVARDAVLGAFDGFYRHCSNLIPVERQAELQAARESFLKGLD